MTADQILDEIKALPAPELARLIQRFRQLQADEIPEDFVEALADFEQGRFVPMVDASQKASVRQAWKVFKADPYHPSLGTHEIHALSARAKHTIYSVIIEADLRVIFRIDGARVTTLDVGTHKIYRR